MIAVAWPSVRTAPAQPAPAQPAPVQPAPVQPPAPVPAPAAPSPPRLRAIPALVVTSDRVVGDPTVTATLKLAELSRVAKLTNLHIEQLDRAVARNAQIDAELTAKNAPAELAAAGRVTVTLEGKGFPIGTIDRPARDHRRSAHRADGRRVRGAQQALHRADRPWFLVFGVFGWIVRHVLKNAEARAELRARLEPLRRQVQAPIAPGTQRTTSSRSTPHSTRSAMR